MKTALATAGTIGSALLAHVPCCGLPIAVAAGSAGGGASFLTILAPYRPWLLGFSIVMALFSLWLAFRPHRGCAHSECHHNEMRQRRLRQGVAIASCLVAVGGLFLPAAHSHQGHSHESDIVLNH